jgi:polyhydroxybutyrate depolymerase
MSRLISPGAFFIIVILLSPHAFAEGSFREKLRERWQNRQAQRAESQDNNKTSSQSPIQEVILKQNGIKRFYYVHVPANYSSSKKTPLVLAFHGGGGSGRIMAKDQYYGWISKSDQEGFIVAFPNGASWFRDGAFATWNAGRCCGYARDNESDDVGFVKDIIKEIKSVYNIDAGRIFATGMSNGGMMSYTLACEMTDTFRAIASVTGTDNTVECHPQKAISVLHIHAKDDDHVLFNGGAGAKAFKDQSQVTDFTSVPETISRWVKFNHCEATAQRTFETDGAYCESYFGCQDDVSVQLCVTEHGGHSWPGAKATPLKKLAPPSKAINATDVIWDFFKSNSK